MNKRGTMKTRAQASLCLGQRIVACLLFAIVVFFVVNPVWECHDHMDNLRHFGSHHGFLVILLLVACAGISLLKSLRWFSLNLLRVSLFSPQLFAIPRQSCDKLRRILTGDLLLPLRI